jgi:hypothetical protein
LLDKGWVQYGDAVCEVEVDGVPRVLTASAGLPADGSEYGGVIRVDVEEGQEVGLSGYVLLYSTSAGKVPALPPASAVGKVRLTRRERYPRVFINYRRDDAEAYAGRLHEALSAAFGEDDVFMDQFSIRTGEVSAWTMQQAVVQADVVVCLIGPRWLEAAGPYGNTRLNDPHDFVRREIVAALDRGKRLLPVLVQGAPLLDSSKLPDELRFLPELQFRQIVDARHWKAEVPSLVSDIREYLGTAEGR